MASSEGYEKGERKREQIILALDEEKGSANTSQIREKTGISANGINYHMAVLTGDRSGPYEDEPAVTRDGQEELPGSKLAANLYRLTEAGHEKAIELNEVYGGLAGRSDESLRRELGELRSEYEQLRQDHDHLKEEYQQLAQDHERYEAKYNELLKRLQENGVI